MHRLSRLAVLVLAVPLVLMLGACRDPADPVKPKVVAGTLAG